MDKFQDNLLKIVNASAGFSRVMQHILSNASQQWGMMSPEVGSLTPQENAARVVEFKKKLSGTGFIPMTGVWAGIPENSFFLPNVSRSQVRALAQEYSQQAYVYGVGGDKPHYWVLLSNDDSVILDGDPREDIDISGMSSPMSREERKDKKREQMEQGQNPTKVVDKGSPDHSEVGLRKFRLNRPEDQMVSGVPLPVEQPSSNVVPIGRAAAGAYYGLHRESAKYVGRDGVHKKGWKNGFFPQDEPNFAHIKVYIPLDADQVNALVPQAGAVRRT